MLAHLLLEKSNHPELSMIQKYLSDFSENPLRIIPLIETAGKVIFQFHSRTNIQYFFIKRDGKIENRESHLQCVYIFRELLLKPEIQWIAMNLSQEIITALSKDCLIFSVLQGLSYK